MQTPKPFLTILLLLALTGGLAAMADDSDIFLESSRVSNSHCKCASQTETRS